MSKKKIIKYILIAFGIIAILAIIEISTRTVINFVSNVIEEKKEEEKIANSHDTIIAQKVDSAVENLVNLITTKNYEELYTKLEDNYRDYKFQTLDSFKTFMNSLLSSENTEISMIEYKEFYENNIRVWLKYTTGEKVTNSYIYLIKNTSDENYKFLLEDITIEKQGYTTRTEYFNITTLYSIDSGNNKSYLFKIENTSNYPIQILKDKTTLSFNTSSQNFKTLNIDESTGDLQYASGQTGRLEIFFNGAKSKIYSGEYLTLYVKLSNGKTYRYIIQLVEDEDNGLIGA